MNVVIYASTSGSTELLANELRQQLPTPVALLNLRHISTLDLAPYHSADLVVAGSPTYGNGNWHLLWELKLETVLPLLTSAKQVSLFGLGDARFHGKTFCGSLGRLFDAVSAAGILPRGASPADKYRYEATPSLRDGVFPGFAIDYKQDYRRASGQIADWLRALA